MTLGARPAGLLRLTVPRAVVPILLEPLIASFCQAYPEVEVEISANAELVDIAAEGFDAGIRLGQFIEADMIAVRLSPPLPLVVVGSPDYLRRAAAAETHRRSARACLPAHAPHERLHRALVLRQRQRSGRVIVSGPLIANDIPTLLGAAVEAWAWRRCPRRSLPGGEGGKTRARAGTLRADSAGRVSLLSRPPSDDAEAARLHRPCEEPVGCSQQDPTSRR